jgi:hypothetical protein
MFSGNILPVTLSALVLIGASATRATGQSYVTGYVPYAGGGYGGYYGGYHASTAAEGYLRGRAELLRASGQASLYYAQALTEREVARRQYLENRMLYLQYRDERREALAQYYEQRREAARQRVQEWKQRTAEEAAADEVAIDWPSALSGTDYAAIRREIEALARVRIELGDAAGKSSELAIRHAIRELAQQIMADEDAAELSEEESSVVRPFVRNLAADILRPEAAERAALAATTSGATVQPERW